MSFMDEIELPQALCGVLCGVECFLGDLYPIVLISVQHAKQGVDEDPEGEYVRCVKNLREDYEEAKVRAEYYSPTTDEM